MSTLINIERIAEVTEISLLTTAGKKDVFTGVIIQNGVLPFVFYYGDHRIIRHNCSKCRVDVEVNFEYKNPYLIGLGSLSRQDFNENREVLDIVGKLFGQHLFHEIDENGFESYLYQSAPENQEGALLDVVYYRCPNCGAQYLMSYQMQIKEHIPPFEPDEILIDKIYQVTFYHDEFLRALNKTSAPIAV